MGDGERGSSNNTANAEEKHKNVNLFPRQYNKKKKKTTKKIYARCVQQRYTNNSMEKYTHIETHKNLMREHTPRIKFVFCCSRVCNVCAHRKSIFLYLFFAYIFLYDFSEDLGPI